MGGQSARRQCIVRAGTIKRIRSPVRHIVENRNRRQHQHGGAISFCPRGAAKRTRIGNSNRTYQCGCAISKWAWFKKGVIPLPANFDTFSFNPKPQAMAFARTNHRLRLLWQLGFVLLLTLERWPRSDASTWCGVEQEASGARFMEAGSIRGKIDVLGPMNLSLSAFR